MRLPRVPEPRRSRSPSPTSRAGRAATSSPGGPRGRTRRRKRAARATADRSTFAPATTRSGSPGAGGRARRSPGRRRASSSCRRRRSPVRGRAASSPGRRRAAPAGCCRRRRPRLVQGGDASSNVERPPRQSRARVRRCRGSRQVGLSTRSDEGGPRAPLAGGKDREQDNQCQRSLPRPTVSGARDDPQRQRE